MKHVMRFLRILFVFAFLLTGLYACPVIAQDGEPGTGEPLDVEPVLDPLTGLWTPPAGGAAEAQQANEPGIPDHFGYAYTEIPKEWIDATGGTNSGLKSGGSQMTGAVPLPFEFKFYEMAYSQAFISAYGYLTFTGGQTNDSQSGLQSTAQPNNLIAGFWAPLTLGNGTAGTGQVYYTSGGMEPERYFAVEWYRVSQSSAVFTFEVVLYENGNFRITQDAMGAVTACGTSGIEDARGIDGLTTIEYCRQPPSNMTYHFTRPADTARIFVNRARHGSLVTAGELAEFHLWGWNTGTLGVDTFDVDVNTSWPTAKVINLATGRELKDTDGDGKVDTGSLQEGARFDLQVQVQAPAFTSIGDKNTTVLQLTSSLNSAVKASYYLDLAVPAPFVAGYRLLSQSYPKLFYAEPGRKKSVDIVTNGDTSSELTTAETPSGNIFFAWTQKHCVGSTNCSKVEIYYAVYDKAGVVVKGPVSVESLGNYQYSVYDLPVSIAPAPNGKVAIAWARTVYNSSNQFTSNLYMRIFDEKGKPVSAVIPITNYTTYGSSKVHPNRIGEVEAVASTNSYFAIGWTQSKYNYSASPNTLTQDNYYAIYNSAGTKVKAPTKATADTSDTADEVVSLSMLSLSGDRLAVLSTMFSPHGYRIHMLALNGKGTVIQPDFIVIQESSGYPDAVQLPNGKIFMAWGKGAIHFALLDGNNFAVLSGPTDLRKVAVDRDAYASVTRDSSGRGIVTWVDYNPSFRQDIFYALVNYDGQILNDSMVMLTDENGIESNYAGRRMTSHTMQAVSTGVDLALSGASSFFALSGGQATVRVQVNNIGSSDASGIHLGVTFPSSITVKSTTPAADCTGTGCTWTIASMPSMGTGLVDIKVAIPHEQVGTPYPMQFSITSADVDADLSNNEKAVTVYASVYLYLPLTDR